MELREGRPTARNAIALRDKKGKAVGSIGQGYDPDLTRQAGAALTKGLSYAPDRLDMHFGLAKMYEVTSQPAEQLRVLRHALATHPAKGKSWRWRDGAALPDLEARGLCRPRWKHTRVSTGSRKATQPWRTAAPLPN